MAVNRERKFLHEQVREGIVRNLKDAPNSIREAVRFKVAQGSSEIAAALFGDSAYRGDLGSLSAAVATQEIQHGIHGPPTEDATEPTPDLEAEAVREVDKAILSMQPEEREIASAFLGRDPLGRARAARGVKPSPARERSH